jgi:hypothetical protein
MWNYLSLTLLLVASSTEAFAPSVQGSHHQDTVLQAVSRRQVGAAFGLSLLGIIPARAQADAGPTKEELERIKVGFNQIQYLLDNFEQQTTGKRLDLIDI